ncbi:dynein intermediate chain 3, ciliary [Plutella xylostella]|uniref:dynein intermediate chain 3, ciliary n=1 Tax=Plutella xylostella TaxID=51655 RepID=UPI002032CDE8|nr:dynein intermediate chain 3, ciliary [Plutella xylostella]
MVGGFQKTTYIYTKKRRCFGKQVMFTAVAAHLLDSIPACRSDQKLYIQRNPVHAEVQATAPQSEHEANTRTVQTRATGVNHAEGGWPGDVRPDNEEHTDRHRRRATHDDAYIHSILHASPSLKHYIDQNNAIEMYQSYFIDMPQQRPLENYKVRVCNEFRDRAKRPVKCVAWTHETHAKVVASYGQPYPGQENEDTSTNECYVWDINRHTEPVYVFYPTSTCCQLACSEVDPKSIVAGLEDGTVSLFDLRASKYSVVASSPYHSHREAISGLQFMHTRTNSEFFTGSVDGQCLWWDTRALSTPVDQLTMSVKLAPNEQPGLSNAEAISTLEYDRGLPTRFLCGTKSGLVVNVNRVGRSHSEVLGSWWAAQAGAVRAVRRSPCTSRMFLTCGDWTARVWSEEVHAAPIIQFPPFRKQLLDAAWAPLRLSSFMLTCANGYFYYWDLLRKYHEPVTSYKVTEHELTNIAPHEEGKFVAAADSNGSVYLLELSDCMTTSGSNDKQLMQQVYARETAREHILDTRLKEIRLKQRQEREDAAGGAGATGERDEEALDQATAAAYWDTVRHELTKVDVLTTPSSQSIH